VCIHFLRGMCKNGTKCDFLHSYQEDKMPICKFITQNGHCHKEESCIYRHPKPDEGVSSKKHEPCPYHHRGFCKLGQYNCMYAHYDPSRPQEICTNYMLGFCPDGPNCNYSHVKCSIAPQDLSLATLANFPPEEKWADQKYHITQQMNHGYHQRQPE
jgi:cleavage and polyadenylation specificity factor subunit 4